MHKLGPVAGLVAFEMKPSLEVLSGGRLGLKLDNTLVAHIIAQENDGCKANTLNSQIAQKESLAICTDEKCCCAQPYPR